MSDDDCKKAGAIGCKQVSDFSVDYLEGTLSSDDKLHFKAHLAACPECVSYFETYKKTPGVTRECFMVGMPEKVRNAIRGFLRDRCRR